MYSHLAHSHSLWHSYHCWSISGSPHFKWLWDLLLCPVEFLEPILSHRKRKKSHGTRSGEYCGCGYGSNLVLHHNMLYWKGDMPKHTIFQSLPPNDTNQMLHYVLHGQICGAPHPSCWKKHSGRPSVRFYEPKILLSKWYFGVPSERLMFRPRIIHKDPKIRPQ